MPDSLAQVTAAHLATQASTRLPLVAKNASTAWRGNTAQLLGPLSALPVQQIRTPSVGVRSAFAIPGSAELCVPLAQKEHSRPLQEMLSAWIALPGSILLRRRQLAAIIVTAMPILRREAARASVTRDISELIRALHALLARTRLPRGKAIAHPAQLANFRVSGRLFHVRIATKILTATRVLRAACVTLDTQEQDQAVPLALPGAIKQMRAVSLAWNARPANILTTRVLLNARHVLNMQPQTQGVQVVLVSRGIPAMATCAQVVGLANTKPRPDHQNVWTVAQANTLRRLPQMMRKPV